MDSLSTSTSSISKVHLAVNGVVDLTNASLDQRCLAPLARLAHHRVTALVDSRNVNGRTAQVRVTARLNRSNPSVDAKLCLRVRDRHRRVVAHTVDANGDNSPTLGDNGTMLLLARGNRGNVHRLLEQATRLVRDLPNALWSA